MKIIFCTCLFILCMCTALLFARKYYKRKLFYYNIYLFNEKLASEILFTKLPLPVFIEKNNNLGDCLLFFEMQDKKFIREKYKKISYLTEDEKNYFFDYFQMLGKSDARTQKEYLESIRQELQIKKTTTDEEYKKHFTLYIKLGVLMGLIAILIIL